MFWKWAVLGPLPPPRPLRCNYFTSSYPTHQFFERLTQPTASASASASKTPVGGRQDGLRMSVCTSETDVWRVVKTSEPRTSAILPGWDDRRAKLTLWQLTREDWRSNIAIAIDFSWMYFCAAHLLPWYGWMAVNQGSLINGLACGQGENWAIRKRVSLVQPLHWGNISEWENELL